VCNQKEGGLENDVSQKKGFVIFFANFTDTAVQYEQAV
jgi:hypothetical protein